MTAPAQPSMHGPDARGYFGDFGGRYVPETLMPALRELEETYAEAREDETFQAELAALLHDYVGRPTPLTRVDRLAKRLGDERAPRVYLKREDLTHTGAHKINAALAQGLLAQRMGKPRIVAETGAGQHGVATATACALLDIECVVYMGAEDVRPPVPQRLPHEAARRRGPHGRVGLPHPQGRDQRGHPRLGGPTSAPPTT